MTDAEKQNAPDASSEDAKAPVEGQDDPGVISDEQLPEDLRPTDDNPLAKPPSDDEEDQGMSINPDGPAT